MIEYKSQELITRDLNNFHRLIFQDNEAALIVIDGFVGSGKTSIAYNLAERFQQNGPIDLNIQYANGSEEFIKKIVQCKEQNKEVIIFDEASDFGTRSSMTGLNRRVNEVFNQYRAFKILVIMCLPSVSFIDRQLFRKGVFRLLIHINKKVNGKYAICKVYSAVQTEFILLRMSKFKANIEIAYNSQKSLYKVEFPPLCAEDDKKLAKLSIKSKVERITDITGYITYKTIAQKLGRSQIWARQKIKSLTIKPERMLGQKKFFDVSVIEKLKNEIKR